MLYNYPLLLSVTYSPTKIIAHDKLKPDREEGGVMREGFVGIGLGGIGRGWNNQDVK